jgi:excisionase family DNA binding protein
MDRNHHGNTQGKKEGGGKLPPWENGLAEGGRSVWPHLQPAEPVISRVAGDDFSALGVGRRPAPTKGQLSLEPSLEGLAAAYSEARAAPRPCVLHGANPPQPSITVTVPEALRLSGLGRTKLYELIADGTLASTTVGRRRLVSYASLKALLDGKGTVE